VSHLDFGTNSDFKARSQICGKRLLASPVCPSVCPHGTTTAHSGWIFMKFYIWAFYGKGKENELWRIRRNDEL